MNKAYYLLNMTSWQGRAFMRPLFAERVIKKINQGRFCLKPDARDVRQADPALRDRGIVGKSTKRLKNTRIGLIPP